MYIQLRDEGYNVVAFSDSNIDKWNTSFCGLQIISPADIEKTLKNFRIIIASVYKSEIYDNLIKTGIAPDKIKTITCFGQRRICVAADVNKYKLEDYIEETGINGKYIKFENEKFIYNCELPEMYSGARKINVAVFINTRNTNLLEQSIRYFSGISLHNVKLALYILDAGTDEYYISNKEIVNNFKSRIEIKHFRYDYNSTIGYRCHHAAGFCSEHYIVKCADDNYIFEKAISAAVKTLEEEKDVTCVTGNTYTMKNKTDISYLYGVVEDFENIDPIKRLISCGKYGTCETHWSIARASVFKDIFYNISSCRDHFVHDFAFYMLNTLYGKIKRLDMPFHIRDDNEYSSGDLVTKRYLFNGLVIDNLFEENCYLYMKNIITNKLVELGYVNIKENNFIFDTAFSNIIKHLYGWIVGDKYFELEDECLNLENICAGISIATELWLLR